MRPVYMCSWCNLTGSEEDIILHESGCHKNPTNILIEEIRKNCPYRERYWEDFYRFYRCKKKPDGRGGYEDCDGGFECENL